MAEYLDVSASLYTKLEAGRTGTSLRTLGRIAEKLDTTVEFLQTGRSPSRRQNADGGTPMTAPGGVPLREELRRLPDETLRAVVRLLLQPSLDTLARNVAGKLDIPVSHAMAVIIRTIMLDPTGVLGARITGGAVQRSTTEPRGNG